ncbi:unnamed protein product [Urochloa humidicola]
MEENMTRRSDSPSASDAAALRGPSPAHRSSPLASVPAAARGSSPRFRPTPLATASPRGPSPPLANGLHCSRSPRGLHAVEPSPAPLRLPWPAACTGPLAPSHAGPLRWRVAKGGQTTALTLYAPLHYYCTRSPATHVLLPMRRRLSLSLLAEERVRARENGSLCEEDKPAREYYY